MSVRAADESTEMLLADYLEGNLAPDRRAEIDAYLSAHPKERAVIDQLAAQRGLLAALPRESAPADVRDAVQSQLERSMLLESLSEIGSEKAVGMRSRPQTLALAAMVVLSLGMGVAIYTIIAPPTRGPQLTDRYVVGPGTSAPAAKTGTGSGGGHGNSGPVTLSQGTGGAGTTGLDAAVGGDAGRTLPGAGGGSPFAPRSSATSRPDPFRTPEPDITFARRASPPTLAAVVPPSAAAMRPSAAVTQPGAGAAAVTADASPAGPMSKAGGPIAASPSPAPLRDRTDEESVPTLFARGAVTVYVDDPTTAPVRLERLLNASGLSFTRVAAADRGGDARDDAWVVRVEPGQDVLLDSTLRRLVMTRGETGAAVSSLAMSPTMSPTTAPANAPTTSPNTAPTTAPAAAATLVPAEGATSQAIGADRVGMRGTARSVVVELRSKSPQSGVPATAPAGPAEAGTAPSTVDTEGPASGAKVPEGGGVPTTKPAGFSGANGPSTREANR